MVSIDSIQTSTANLSYQHPRQNGLLQFQVGNSDLLGATMCDFVLDYPWILLMKILQEKVLVTATTSTSREEIIEQHVRGRWIEMRWPYPRPTPIPNPK
ncbi:hypothetical protein ACFX15_015462 [Malus domestica]